MVLFFAKEDLMNKIYGENIFMYSGIKIISVK